MTSDSVCPSKGRLFSNVDYRYTLTKAAKAAGLSDFRAEHLSYHDWRHAALTHMASRTTDLPGMAWLAGHKDVTTTAKYVHAGKEAAARVLRARRQPHAVPSGTTEDDVDDADDAPAENGFRSRIGHERQKQESPAEAGLTASHRNDSVAEERTRTSTGVTPQEPESCASASSATSAGVSKEAVRYVVEGSLSSSIDMTSNGTPKSFHTSAPSAAPGARAGGPSG